MKNKHKISPHIIEMDYAVLEAVARYYEFPVAVFFMPKKEWNKPHLSGTRLTNFVKEQEKLERIREILNES